MLGASATTPGNDQLRREFQGQRFTKEHALKSSVETLRDPRDMGKSSRFKLRRIHEVSSFK